MPGETLTIPISVEIPAGEAAKSFSGFDIVLQYDSSILTFNSASSTSFTNGFSVTANPGLGVGLLAVGAFSVGSTNPITSADGPQLLANLSFTIDASAGPGSTVVNLRQGAGGVVTSLFDADTNELILDPRPTDQPTDSVDSTVTIEVNEPPSAVAVAPLGAVVPSSQDMTSRLKVGEITVTDDGLGTNSITLSGDDEDVFEIIGMDLYLKAGVPLTRPAAWTTRQYNVTVEARDETIPDAAAVSVDFSVVVNQPPDGSSLSQTFTVLPAVDAVPSPVVVADFHLWDDAVSTLETWLTGPDADSFFLSPTDSATWSLWLKQGVELTEGDVLSVTIEGRDPMFGDSLAAENQVFTLAVGGTVTMRFGSIGQPLPTYRADGFAAVPFTVVGGGIDPDTLTADDFIVTRDGEPVDVTGASVYAPSFYSFSTGQGLLWGVTDSTTPKGEYTLTLNASGVDDLFGRPLADDVAFSWTNTDPVPYVSSETGWGFLAEAQEFSHGSSFLQQGDTLSGIATDPDDATGRVFAVGTFSGEIQLDPLGEQSPLTASSGDGTDGFIAVYNATGALLSTWILPGVDVISDVAVAGDIIYLAGEFAGEADFDPRSDREDRRISSRTGGTASEAGLRDGFVMGFDAESGTPTGVGIVTLSIDAAADLYSSGAGIRFKSLAPVEGGVAVIGSVVDGTATFPSRPGEEGVSVAARPQDYSSLTVFATRFNEDGSFDWVQDFAPQTEGHPDVLGDIYHLNSVLGISSGSSTDDRVVVGGSYWTTTDGSVGRGGFIVVGLNLATGQYEWHRDDVLGSDFAGDEWNDNVHLAASAATIYASGLAWFPTPTNPNRLDTRFIGMDAGSGTDAFTPQFLSELAAIPETHDALGGGLVVDREDRVLLMGRQQARDAGIESDFSESMAFVMRLQTNENAVVVDPVFDIVDVPLVSDPSKALATADGRLVFLNALPPQAASIALPTGLNNEPQWLIKETSEESATAIWSVESPFLPGTIVDRHGDVILSRTDDGFLYANGQPITYDADGDGPSPAIHVSKVFGLWDVLEAEVTPVFTASEPSEVSLENVVFARSANGDLYRIPATSSWQLFGAERVGNAGSIFLYRPDFVPQAALTTTPMEATGVTQLRRDLVGNLSVDELPLMRDGQPVNHRVSDSSPGTMYAALNAELDGEILRILWWDGGTSYREWQFTRGVDLWLFESDSPIERTSAENDFGMLLASINRDAAL